MFVGISYRLLNRDEIFEKKLVRPECGESAVWAPEPEYSREALFRGLVCPAKRDCRRVVTISSGYSADLRRWLREIKSDLHLIQSLLVDEY